MTNAQANPDAVMALLAQGLSYRTVADQLGISRSRVGLIAQQNGHNVADAIALRAEADACQAARIEPKGACPHVPPWVSAAGLTEDYRDTARDFGEHAAARHCRQLLAEMRLCA